MTATPGSGAPAADDAVTGRITGSPAALLDHHVLQPQFRAEAQRLLPHYLAVEHALLRQYRALGVLDTDETAALHAALDEVGRRGITPDAAVNFSDVAFAVEQAATAVVGRVVPRWHVDRSRNDLQATAQRMAARAELLDVVAALLELLEVTLRRADELADVPLPGQTHLQAAQVISPGFFCAAMAEELCDVLGSLSDVWRILDRCPLGAGAMAGQDLAWDRAALAADLGFAGPVPSALVAVASRQWVLALTGVLSTLGVTVSRFVTDLMTWGSGAVGWLWLPDELAGISSAMPQKRNYPVLERIRGRAGHLTALHVDVALGQRNTTFTNLVEVSKEAATALPGGLADARATLQLLTAVVAAFRVDADRATADAAREFLGAFTVANALTLEHGVPWRRAQVLAGRFVVAALEQDLHPGTGRTPELAALLGRVLAEDDAPVVAPDPAALGALLERAFDPGEALRGKDSAGGTSPRRVREELAVLTTAVAQERTTWQRRRDTVARVTEGGR